MRKIWGLYSSILPPNFLNLPTSRYPLYKNPVGHNLKTVLTIIDLGRSLPIIKILAKLDIEKLVKLEKLGSGYNFATHLTCL